MLLSREEDVTPQARKRGRPPADTVQSVDERILLAAAFAMFAERGYEATTLRELSRILGISHNLLNVRFGRKSNLWRAAVDWRLAEASRSVIIAFDQGGDAEQRLRELIRRFCVWALENRDIVSLSYLEGQRASWRLDHLVERFIQPFQRRLDLLIEEVRMVRFVQPLSTTALMALLVQGVGFYFSAQPLQEKLGDIGQEDPALQQERAARFATLLINGLLADG